MPLLTCPAPGCESGMNEVVRNGVHIDVCPKCRGVWLDPGEMERLLGQVRQYEREYEAELEGYRQHDPRYAQNPDYRRTHDTDPGYDDRRKRKKSKLEQLFDIFD
ncbi:Transcription factor zinc-finger [Calidithermus terrae]|uniref:Transcription factor zinc-finger n=1 Tax=Calidithermus terrae TaxID=1408545 RepID=A0A399EDH1_9DEIN|nr:zf-TFIIB domain-containing protein [Calidithermus terrae]RIH80192.1 Transcription factor zinc-finger [Calidithermus terrae]